VINDNFQISYVYTGCIIWHESKQFALQESIQEYFVN